jgi:ATP-dependent Clp protease ATP-binding subunit ClpC
MFERYTEKARRVIFFARYEASQFGSPYIETEHMLLGFLREDKGFAMQVIPFLDAESIRQEIEKATLIREKTSTSVDIPISNECKRVFAYAAEWADRLNHQHVGTEHLVLGILREQNCFAARLLQKRGVTLESVRASLQENTEGLPGLGQTGARTGFGGGGGGRLIRPETRVVMRR